MISNIVDNIQLNIENIHFRVHGGQSSQDVFYSLDEEEEPTVMDRDDDKSFAFGFCIKSIFAYTTDEEWNRKFVNRSEEKLAAMRKKLFFDGISAYWEDGQVVPLESLKAEDIRHLMG